MKQRLGQLKIELERGRQRLELIERERQEIRDTLLRISGAIQVLEELDADRSQGSGAGEMPNVA
jgi:hypothetical protein